MGWIVGWFGHALHAALPARPVLSVGLVLIVLLGGSDLLRRSQWALGLQRQTNPRWRYYLGAEWAALLWGVELGLGFTTFRITSLYWAVLLLIVVTGSPPVGALTMATYGLFLGINLLWGQGVLLARRISPSALLRYSRRLRRVLATALVVGSSVMLAVLLIQGPLM